MPLISVVIPTYNRASLVGETIQSVLNQTFDDFEVIVVDDGSSDNTAEALKPLIESGQVRYVFQENAGLPAARNTGIREAQGKYITFLDSDDLFMKTKLEKQAAFLEAHPEIAIVQSDFSKFDNQGRDLGVRRTSYFKGEIYPQILSQWDTLMATPCVMLRVEVFDEVGGFDESLDWAEDLDMWVRISQKYEFGYIPESLANIRVHSASMSANKTDASSKFRIYLEKAFERDETLGEGIKKKAFAKMYTYSSLNILGEGTREDMKVVRANCTEALNNNPFEIGAYFAYLISFIPIALRRFSVRLWRSIRYRQMVKVI